MDALSMLTDLIEGLTDEQLARVCRNGQVRVNGFRNLSKAPRPLLVSAIHASIRTGPGAARELVREWGEANSELAQAWTEQGARLAAEGADPDLVAWVRELYRVHGRTRALQVMVYTAYSVPALMERFGNEELRAALQEFQEEFEQAEAPEPVAPAEPPTPAEPPASAEVPEPAPVAAAPEPVVVEAVASAKAGRLAAQVKELQQQLKALRAEKTALERKLETTENRANSFRDEALRLRAETAALRTGQDYPEPKERVKRLVEALFEALREADSLRGALEEANHKGGGPG